MFTPVAAHLARLAAVDPHRAALLIPTRRVRHVGETPHAAVSFAELSADAEAVARGVLALGLAPGERVAVFVPPSRALFALTFGLFLSGVVPVLVDPGMGLAGLRRCLGHAKPAAFFGVPKAHLARRLFGLARGLRLTVNVAPAVTGGRFFCHASLAEVRALGRARLAEVLPAPGPNDAAAVLFTSGSTGPAKGVPYTHGHFAAQVELLRQVYGIEPGEVDLCSFPLFALFGPALGMTCVVPDLDPTRPATADPRRLMAQARQFNVTNVFGSPAVLRNWANSGEVAPPSVRRVLSAGAPATPEIIAAVAKLVPPGAQVFTPYGATEALPVANVGSAELLAGLLEQTRAGAGVCVGRPVPGVAVEVIAITDEPVATWEPGLTLPDGRIGEFVVRGPVVTREYFNDPAATRRAKIFDPATGETLHRMGDVGYRDAAGRLWLCGRKSHVVWAKGGPLFPDQVEAVLNTAGVFRTALVGVTRGGEAFPVVCVQRYQADYFPRIVEIKPGAWGPYHAALAACAAAHTLTRSITTFLDYGPLPLDARHNSKIAREKLAAWADRRLPADWRPPPPGSPS